MERFILTVAVQMDAFTGTVPLWCGTCRKLGPRIAGCYWLQGMLSVQARGTAISIALNHFTSAQSQTLIAQFSSVSVQMR